MRVPALLLAGTEGPAHARWSAARLAESIPQGHLLTLLGAGHMAHLTHAREVAAAIDALVARRSATVEPAGPVPSSSRDLPRSAYPMPR